MQLLREQPWAGETVDIYLGNVRKRAENQPRDLELGAIAAASTRPAVTSTFAAEALTPLPRARSLILLSDTASARPDAPDVTSDGLSGAGPDVVEAPSRSVAGPLHSRPRREFDDVSKADEEVLFPKKFRHDMLWLDIWGLPLPFLAFALTHREDVDPTCSEVRDAIARVNCVEGGTWGKNAQALLRPTVSAFGPQKPKQKGGQRGPEREPDWSTSNWCVRSLLLEEAANRLRGRHVHAVRRGLSHPVLARGGAALSRLRSFLFDAG